ncbi:uncharacterized protein LOC105830734, partial [Monomorium pharaonis]|uniref:uncharacterized protein LOC105830734 n=1 Tax=Monomorium pharaonis TaxID=307658 RepID=UPI001746E9D8
TPQIPVVAILGVAAGAQLTLLPYAYLAADPLPVYHQSQDTRAGVHAYSYAGGPSAKEEVRGLDGVTRGSYSYVDAHGILQSVFYVADEGGFRVAATNLPTDGGELLTAKISAHNQEEKASRRKRSLEALPVDQDRHQAENPSSQGDQADREGAAAKSSHELPASEEKSSEGERRDSGAAQPIVHAPVYGLLGSVLIPRLTGAATSHQSRVDVNNNVRLKAVQPVETIGVLSETVPAHETVILPSQVPLATSHQSRVQVHDSLRVEVPEKVLVNAETIEVQPQIAQGAAAVKLDQPLSSLTSALPDYNENRIQLHRNLGLEGPNRKNAVKIDAAQLAIATVPVVKHAVPIVTEEPLPVATAVSSQSRTQIHRNIKLEVAVPIEPAVYLTAPYVQPFSIWPILAPIAQSSQYRHQIHSNEKL